MMPRNPLISGVLALIVIAAPAGAQSLYQLGPSQDDLRTGATDAGPATELQAVSMFSFEPPPPREFAPQDIITIIIDESARTESSQTLETEKENSTRANLRSVLDPLELLELRLLQGNLSDVDLIDYSSEREFKGEGDYERTDRFSARISARVLEVKPNGTLLLEASSTIRTDEEERTLVLSGLARPEDVTEQNTVRSSQLANLVIQRDHEGQVAQAATKGLITRVLDFLFNH